MTVNRKSLVSFFLFLSGCATKYECVDFADRFAGEVCGSSGQIYCVQAPCPSHSLTTFENSQSACESSEYYTKGKCKVEGLVYGAQDPQANQPVPKQDE